MKNSFTRLFSLFLVLFSINNAFSQCPTSLNGFTVLGEYEGNKYFLSNETATWEEAKVIAQTNGGHIVSITSQAENDYILSNINDIIFTGFNDATQEGEFGLVSGEPLTYNNYTGSNSWSIDYGTMNFWDGKWGLDGKYTSRKYIVEINCDGTAPNGITLNCPSNLNIQLGFNEGYATLDYGNLFNATTTCINGINDVEFFSNDANFSNGSKLVAGNYNLSVAAVDLCGNVETCDFTLNVISGNTSSGLPDLRASNVSSAGFFFFTYYPGRPSLVSFDLDNVGNSIAPGTIKSKIYLSTTPTINANSILLDEVDAMNVPAGKLRQYFTFDIPNNTADGDYYLVLKVDDENSVSELNENNNTESIAIAVFGNTPEPFCAFDLLSPITYDGDVQEYGIVENSNGLQVVTKVRRGTGGDYNFFTERNGYSNLGADGGLFGNASAGLELSKFGFSSYITKAYNPTQFQVRLLGVFGNVVGAYNISITNSDADISESVSLDVKETNDHILVTGVYKFGNSYRPFLVQLDLLGKELWQQTYPATDNLAEFTYVGEAANGGYYLTLKSGNEYIDLIRTDESGNVTWSERMADDLNNNNAIVGGETPDGNGAIYVVSSTANAEATVIKLNAETGDELWMTDLATTYYNDPAITVKSIRGIVLDKEGGVVLNTSFSNSGSDFTTYSRLNTDGNEAWNFNMPAGKEEYVPKFAATDGGFLFTKIAPNPFADPTGNPNGIALFYVDGAGSFAPNCDGTGGGGPTTGPCPDALAGFELLGEFNGSKYFLSNSEERPTDAQDIAESNGGDLVTIDNQAENDFLKNVINEVVYIGLNDFDNEGTPVWADGEPLNFQNFDDCSFCEPNSAEQDFTVLQGWNGQWSWSNFYSRRKYIVEVKCTILLVADEKDEVLEQKRVTNASTENVVIENLFPNPTTDQINMIIESLTNQTIDLQVYNANGQVLKSTRVNLEIGKNIIRTVIKDLPDGIYSVYSPQLSINPSKGRFVKMSN